MRLRRSPNRIEFRSLPSTYLLLPSACKLNPEKWTDLRSLSLLDSLDSSSPTSVYVYVHIDEAKSCFFASLRPDSSRNCKLRCIELPEAREDRASKGESFTTEIKTVLHIFFPPSCNAYETVFHSWVSYVASLFQKLNIFCTCIDVRNFPHHNRPSLYWIPCKYSWQFVHNIWLIATRVRWGWGA